MFNVLRQRKEGGVRKTYREHLLQAVLFSPKEVKVSGDMAWADTESINVSPCTTMKYVQSICTCQNAFLHCKQGVNTCLVRERLIYMSQT